MIAIDGRLDDWTLADRIDRSETAGYAIYGRSDGSDFVFALKAAGTIGANTTFWLNTDRNTATGYQIFGFAGGAEYNVNVGADGKVSLFTGGAGETLVQAGLPAAWSADGSVLEFRVPKAAIGNPQAIDTLVDINDAAFLPGSYSSPGYTVFNDAGITPDPAQRIAIVWSESTAKNYFSETAYTQLFMAAQSQAMQAGVPFDILTESDLTSLATVAKYDTIVFPSFRNVDAGMATRIAQTLEQATKQYGVGLVAGGEFMTNDATGAALAGDSYARMKLLFDATRVTGGTGDVTLTASDAAGLVLDGYDNGQLIRQYTGVGWNAFESVSGTGKAIATETIGGQSYAAALATQTGGHNVLFSSEAVMADDNLLQKAIDYSVNGSGLSVGLQMTREKGMVAARVDMDQSQERFEVKPEDGSPGIYDKMLPILQQWKTAYNFVGSYYVNIGNDPANGRATDWAVSLPVYKALIDMGNELGLHSYTHPENTNLLTPAQVAFEFGSERAELEAKLSGYLGKTVSVGGAAVPGAPEMLPTSQEIMKYVDYLSGGYSGVGAGYPNAFGFLPTTKTVAGPNLIVNGSFESAPVAANGWRVAANGSVAGWTGGSGIEVWNNGFNGVKPSDGANVVEVDAGTGALMQAVRTEAGKTYSLSFDYAGRPGAIASSTFEVVWNGKVVATIAPTGSTMAQQKLTVTGTGGNDTLAFRAVAGDSDGLGALLDNVSLASVTSAGPSFDKVYLAPNTAFDFTLMEFQKKTVAEAEAVWAKEFAAITSEADAPVVLWPWHDYGPTSWTVDGASPYTQAMFTNYIARAAEAGMEFVTLEQLADRIAAFKTATITSTVSGNTITATVGATRGDFALDVDGQAGMVIKSVAGWYAYSADKVFLPKTGGTYVVAMGAAADDVTHITALPMRAILESVSGDGRNLAFAVTGEGRVTIDLKAPGSGWVTVTGATKESLAGEILTLNVAGGGVQKVSVGIEDNVGPVITSLGGGDTANVRVAEFTTAVATATATDANITSGDAVTWSIAAGADGALFAIDAKTGALSFRNAPDVTKPQDYIGRDNIYDVRIVATDARGATDTQMVYVTVTDANKAPVITSLGGGDSASVRIAENTAAVATATASDANAATGDAVTWSIAAGADGALFSIDATTGALAFRSAPDFENPQDYIGRDNIYDVRIVATDARGATDTQLVYVTVADVAGLNRTGGSGNDVLTGTSEQDLFDGGRGNDALYGLGGNDRLIGADGNDWLDGGEGNDVLIGGKGTDMLTGGKGADVFRFETKDDSGIFSFNRDVVTDFVSGTDKIDLAAIDANTSLFARGDQAFTFLSNANANFTAAGQLRYRYEWSGGKEYTIVEGNTDSGRIADFSFALLGHHNLTSGDFFL